MNHYEAMEAKEAFHRNEMICQCTHCDNAYFVNKSALNNHCVEKHPDLCRKCADCGKLFMDAEDMKVHKKKAHTLQQRFDCAHCENRALQFAKKKISSTSLRIQMFTSDEGVYNVCRKSRC
jgi:hypothetical protein